ncbi:MAG: C69 family dipeptidase [Planctomycetes bacterium]|nr:C69 family dipeptidase [Planctomycetota bacterium]
MIAETRRWAKAHIAATLVLFLVLLVGGRPCRACFSIIVGKKASTEGRVIVAHNEDDAGPQIVNHHKVPRRSHPAGTKVSLRNGGSLEQVPQTWAYIWSQMPGLLFSDSYVNEWGVTVASDGCPSREDKPELIDGGIGYTLRRLVAERAKTAREGVLLAGKLVERFGYIDSGRTYIIADPEEGWLFCVVNGKHWLAQRVADDEVAMVANTYTIRTVNLQNKANFLASADIVDYAKSRGWYNPQTDGPFDFAKVYASPKAATHPNNIGRQWSGLSEVARNKLEPGPSLPFSVVPKHKLSVLDAMQILRHDREDESGPTPADSPFVCALCSGATQTSFVIQVRKGVPLDIGLVYWVCLASPRTSFYIPFHFGISDFPAGFRLDAQKPTAEAYNRKVQAPFTVNPQEAFWTFSNFRDKVDARGPTAVTAAKTAAQRVEQDAVALQKPLEEATRRLYKTDRATAMRLLENYSRGVDLSALEALSSVLSGSN